MMFDSSPAGNPDRGDAIPPLKRILLVEDDPDVQGIASFALGKGGFAFEACGTGTEALERASVFAPHLALLDVTLRFTDGPAVLATMRHERALADTPVVVVTAHATPEEIARYRELGSLDVIV